MNLVTVSAPGKLHLSGEHTVVYGYPAVLTTVSARVYVTITQTKSAEHTHPTVAINNDAQKSKPWEFVQHIIHLVGQKYETEIKNVSLEIHSHIPWGVGMGSSAALAVATVGALTQYLQKPWNPNEINELAFTAEKKTHKSPSGGDNTISTFGGLLWYRREFEFLKTFWLLPQKFPKNFPKALLIETPRAETTGDLVIQVAKIPQTKRQKIAAKIEQVTRQLVQAIHDEDSGVFMAAVSENQRQLEKLGVVSPSVKKLIKDICQTGAVAKISGAGGIKTGSGIVIAFGDNHAEIQKIAARFGYKTMSVTLGAEGVRREQVIV